MSIYRYSSDSAVSAVQFRYANDHPPVALLAAGNVDDSTTLAARRALEGAGFACVPVAEGERTALQVHGFQEAGQLVAFLASRGFVRGEPRVTAEPGDHPTRTWMEWLEDTSLKACGWSYLVGDGALLASGILSGRKKEITSGALYTAGGAILARYGNVQTEHHVRDVSERMGEFLRTQTGALPGDCSLHSVLQEKQRGPLTALEHFLYRNPSQSTLGLYTLGAFSMLQSGIQHGKPWDIAYGVNSTATKIASMLIPEKHFTPAEKEASKKKGPLGRLWDWVQEKPLRITGYMSLLSAGTLGMSAFREYKANPAQRSYILKAITAGTYALGDVLLAISNKQHTNGSGTFDAEEQRRVEALAAEAIVRQPESARWPLAHHVASFLSEQPEINGDASTIASHILTQVRGLEQSPWVCRTQKPALATAAAGRG